MAGKVADRLGLTATGLTSSGLSATATLRWLDRVRAGGLDPAESAATLQLIYRAWLAGLFLKALGSGWDVAWHFRFIRDDFAPPHIINLIGDGIVIALVLFHWYTHFGVDKVALRLMTGGLALFIVSAPIDVINHRINGLDITAWSVTHFGLYTGTGIAIAGAIRGWRQHSMALGNRSLVLGGLWLFFLENVLFPNQHQEYGIEEIASWDRGAVYADESLLQFAAERIGGPVGREAVVQFSLPVPAWVYPMWIVGAAMLTLALARRSIGTRWAATALAGAYVAWRCVLWPPLAMAEFPTSAIPFLLLAGALAIDVVAVLELPWLGEAAAGAALVTAAVYVAAFVQSYVAVAPPVSNWSAPAAAAVLFASWACVAYARARRGTTLF
jgi:hypothetical protein